MDQERRALERAAASGDAEAEARLLALRVRAGQLPEGWLEAAARLGHEPARRALGRWVPFLLPERAPRLAGVIGAPLAVRLLTEERPDALRDVPERFRTHFAAARAWAHDPGPATAAALASAVADLDITTLLDELPPEAGGLGPWVLGPVDSLLRGPTEATPALLADALASLANAGEARWRAIRQAVARWALEPPRAPAPVWPTDDDPRAAWSAAAQVFDAALASKEVRERAEELRERRRAKRLRKALLGLAADLGDPAAWLADRRGGRPNLDAPTTADQVADRLLTAVENALGAEHGRSDDDRQPAPPWAPDCAARLIASAAWPGADPTLVRAAGADWGLTEDGPAPPAALRELVAGSAHADPAAAWARLRSDLVAWALGDTTPEPAPVVASAGPARPYAPKERYAVGDRIDHPKFGAGAVTRVTKDKVDVAFADGPRTLVHGRP